MDCKISWIYTEDHDELWNDPLSWNRIKIQVESSDPNMFELEKEIAHRENTGTDNITIMDHEITE